MNIGFIGAGNIGAPIAGQLLAAGHDIAVHDLRPAAAEALLADGARWAPSPAAIAAKCDADGVTSFQMLYVMRKRR